MKLLFSAIPSWLLVDMGHVDSEIRWSPPGMYHTCCVFGWITYQLVQDFFQ